MRRERERERDEEEETMIVIWIASTVHSRLSVCV